MVLFSKFLVGRRGSQLLLDSNNYTYGRKKVKDTALSSAWRCTKHNSLKCRAMCYLSLDNSQSLSNGSTPHNHQADSLVEEKQTLITTLKRKAADQELTPTQNVLSEVLKISTPDLNCNLPRLDSLKRVVQRSRQQSSGTTHRKSNKSRRVSLCCHPTASSLPEISPLSSLMALLQATQE